MGQKWLISVFIFYILALNEFHHSVFQYLEKAWDWEMLVDVGQQLPVPSHIVTTTLRPDALVQHPAPHLIGRTDRTLCHFRLTIDVKKVTKMLDEEQDEEDEAMLCLDSESEISEVKKEEEAMKE